MKKTSEGLLGLLLLTACGSKGPVAVFWYPTDESPVVSGGFEIELQVQSAQTVRGVEFFVDAHRVASLHRLPYILEIDTLLLDDGPHRLVATAVTEWDSATAELPFFVDNSAPTVRVKAPLVDVVFSELDQLILLSASVFDPSGPTQVTFFVDDQEVGTFSASPFSMTIEPARLGWDFSAQTDRTFRVEAQSPLGHQTVQSQVFKTGPVGSGVSLPDPSGLDRVAWSHVLTGMAAGPIAVDSAESLPVVVTEQGRVSKLSATGTEAWAFSADNPVASGVAVAPGRLMVGDMQAVVYELAPAAGTELGRKSLPGVPAVVRKIEAICDDEVSPFYNTSYVLVSLMDGRVVLDISYHGQISVETILQRPARLVQGAAAGGLVTTSPTLGTFNDLFVVGAYADGVLAIAELTTMGGPMNSSWDVHETTRAAGYWGEPAAVAAGVSTQSNGDVWVGGADGALYLIGRTNPTPVSVTNLGQPIKRPPAAFIQGNVSTFLVVVTDDGRLHGLRYNPTTRQADVLWQTDPEPVDWWAPAFSSDRQTVYLASTGGHVRAYPCAAAATQLQPPLWQMTLGEIVAHPPTASTDLLYVATVNAAADVFKVQAIDLQKP